MPAQDWDLLSSYAGLLSLATFSIYSGSYGSLKAPKSRKNKDATDNDSDDEDEVVERLQASDAYLFPILGSVVLVGLYLVVTYLGNEWINWLLGWYFTLAGTGSIWRCSIAILRQLVGPARWKAYPKLRFLILKGPWELFALSLRTPSLVLLVPSVAFTALYALLPGSSKSAILTDILALSFSHATLSLLKLDSFQTGSIMLAGLFAYDIWWVFGTKVMVKVATSLDVPIKILWPKSLVFSTERGFTMLGLGDIVVPGLFISLALRYDLSRSGHQQPSQAYQKPYFTAALASYVLGLGSTMTVMHVFGAAQPALLYLSPACIISFLIAGLLQGDLLSAWAWKDDAEEDSSETSTVGKGDAVNASATSAPKTQLNGAADKQAPLEDKGTTTPAAKDDAGNLEVSEGTVKKRNSKKKHI